MSADDLTFGPAKVAPGVSDEPYVLQSLCGEVIYIPCSRSATRLLVTGKESDNSFAVVGTGGAAGDPIGFHFHREAHDVFFCLKGNVNVWAGDQCRTLSAGDFASVPPGVIHSYQILGDYTEFIGLIVPGGWEEFFRFIGEPYDGPLFPLQDDRNVFEVLIPKLKAAAAKFDMIPVPHHPMIEPQPWSQANAGHLPGDVIPYFLRTSMAPRYCLGGIVASVIAGKAESAGRFTIGSIEGSSWHQSNPLSHTFTFDQANQAFYIAEGSFTLTLDHKHAASVNSGELVYVPRGHALSLKIRSRYAKAYVFSNGDSLVSIVVKAGNQYSGTVPPQDPAPWTTSQVECTQSDVGFRLG